MIKIKLKHYCASCEFYRNRFLIIFSVKHDLLVKFKKKLKKKTKISIYNNYNYYCLFLLIS